MNQPQLRQWRRSYRLRRARRRALNNLLRTTLRLIAVSLVAVAFLFYRLDMPGTHTYFTASAQTEMVTIKAGVWHIDEVEVWVVKPTNQFNTQSDRYVTVKIGSIKDHDFQDVDPGTAYLEYSGNRVINPESELHEDGLELTFEEVASLFIGKLPGGKTDVDITIGGELYSGVTFSGECQLTVNVPPGHAQVEFRIVSTGEGINLSLSDEMSRGHSSQGQLVAANIHLDGYHGDQIDQDSIRLVYGDSSLQPAGCQVEGDNLLVYFDRAQVDNWLAGLGVEEGRVFLAVVGSILAEGESLPFSGGNYYELAAQIEPMEGEQPIHSLIIEGPATITIPGEGEITEVYRALVEDRDGQTAAVGEEVAWSIAEEIQGVSAAENGGVTVTSAAEEGTFTLAAALVGQEDIKASLSIELAAEADTAEEIVEELDEEGEELPEDGEELPEDGLGPERGAGPEEGAPAEEAIREEGPEDSEDGEDEDHDDNGPDEEGDVLPGAGDEDGDEDGDSDEGTGEDPADAVEEDQEAEEEGPEGPGQEQQPGDVDQDGGEDEGVGDGTPSEDPEEVPNDEESQGEDTGYETDDNDGEGEEELLEVTDDGGEEEEPADEPGDLDLEDEEPENDGDTAEGEDGSWEQEEPENPGMDEETDGSGDGDEPEDTAAAGVGEDENGGGQDDAQEPQEPAGAEDADGQGNSAPEPRGVEGREGPAEAAGGSSGQQGGLSDGGGSQGETAADERTSAGVEGGQ